MISYICRVPYFTDIGILNSYDIVTSRAVHQLNKNIIFSYNARYVPKYIIPIQHLCYNSFNSYLLLFYSIFSCCIILYIWEAQIDTMTMKVSLTSDFVVSIFNTVDYSITCLADVKALSRDTLVLVQCDVAEQFFPFKEIIGGYNSMIH